MKKLLVIVCLLIVSLPAFSQAFDQTKLDLSKAELAIAGPDVVYVTNILYDRQVLSVLLKWDGGTGAVIYGGPWFATDKVLQDSYDLGYATVRTAGTDKIIISDIVIGARAYTGTAVFDGKSKFLLERVWETTMPTTPEMQINALQGRINTNEKVYQANLAETEAKRAADKVVYEAEIDKLKNELAAAMQAAKTAGVAPEKIETIVSKPGRIAASGFTGGRGLSGNWVVTSSRLSQTDQSAYFAKYMVPLSQSSP
ncbi:MAG: hypothetical protein JW852_01400, partial [Spirochaetales bacterium]|nr:hypothetical protein [Spirochaetales bacterium]